MNCVLLNNKCNKPPCTIKQGGLPLWFIVLFFAALTLFLSSLISYFSEHHERSDLIKSQMAGLFEQKEELLQQEDVINTNWLRTLNARMKDVRGGVVWSSGKQQGIVSFQNLPKLGDLQQYRLWVYDLSRLAGERISAAIFKGEANGGDEYFVEIKPDASLKLPYKFELVLEELGPERKLINELPLLLAQP